MQTNSEHRERNEEKGSEVHEGELRENGFLGISWR
jgi:hypothetical protein